MLGCRVLLCRTTSISLYIVVNINTMLDYQTICEPWQTYAQSVWLTDVKRFSHSISLAVLVFSLLFLFYIFNWIFFFCLTWHRHTLASKVCEKDMKSTRGVCGNDFRVRFSLKQFFLKKKIWRPQLMMQFFLKKKSGGHCYSGHFFL